MMVRHIRAGVRVCLYGFAMQGGLVRAREVHIAQQEPGLVQHEGHRRALARLHAGDGRVALGARFC